jgi:YVTN family beta-propeller protein
MADRSGTAYIFNRRWGFQAIVIVLFVCLIHLNTVFAQPGQPKQEGSHAKTTHKLRAVDNHRVVKEGVAIELSTRPLSSGKENSQNLVEGQDAKIQFTLKDPNTGEALRGLYPAAWMDKKRTELANLSCKEKIGSFLQARVGFQPEVDLNTWYILALNHKGSISVIDPLVDSGESGMLLDLVLLESPGEAWTLSPAGRWLYVTLPETGKVAVIDTDIWKVTTQIETGSGSNQIAFQPDQRYLWVGLDQGIEGPDKPGGVSIIDPLTRKVVSRIQTGRGHHEFAFSDDSHYAYVTNESDGTVSVIDIRKIKKLKDIKTGTRPTSLAYSKTAHAVYTADTGEGNIYVIGQSKNEVTAKIAVKPGVTGIRFSPDGRWGFVSDPKSKSIVIFDASSNKISHTFTVGKGPNQVVFNDTYAYVHSVGSSKISLIKIGALSERGSIPVVQIPVGKDPSREMSNAITADMIALTPEESSVVVANPVDENIFYYMEGMNAPMGSFGNFQRSPKAVMTVDKGLKETSPGLYEAHVKLKNPGTYDVAFLLDNPKITHCFTLSVADDPAIQAKKKGKLKMELVSPGKKVTAGQPLEVRVRLKDSLTGKPRSGVKDLQAQAILAPGIWQRKVLTESGENGEYIARFSFPTPGIYMVSFESRSLNVPLNNWYPLIFKATMVKKAEGTLANPGKPIEKK